MYRKRKREQEHSVSHEELVAELQEQTQQSIDATCSHLRDLAARGNLHPRTSNSLDEALSDLERLPHFLAAVALHRLEERERTMRQATDRPDVIEVVISPETPDDSQEDTDGS